jgi:hypothetical protein
MLATVVVPLTIIVVFISQDFRIPEIVIPFFVLYIYLPTAIIALGFERTETHENRLRLLGLLPLTRNQLGHYRLVFLCIVYAIFGIYYLIINHVVTINSVKLSPVFILSLISFFTFYNLGHIFFCEFKRLPIVYHWILRICMAFIWTGWMMYLMVHEAALKLFPSAMWLTVFILQTAVMYYVIQALFIRRKTLYS